MTNIRLDKLHFSLAIMLLLTIIVYWTGLNGPFLFDDFANLPSLGDYNGVRNWDTLKLYLSSGHAGPTGRPLALLSFLIDARTWPADPWQFKFTNLMFHLVNGALLYSITFNMILLMGKKCSEAVIFSSLATGLWLLHPFLVSTILYPVQRMAILPATFSLLGFWIYLQGRKRIESHPVAAFLLLSAAVGVCTLLALISKENGVLLPLLLALFEFFILRHSTLPKLPKKWVLFFLVLPSVVILTTFIYKIPAFISGHSGRDFTASERLLTQSRAMTSYLTHLFFPQAITNGLHTDSFIKSTSLFNPISTILSLLALFILAVTAWITRNRFPLFGFSIFFFFTAHLIESSIVPLELYYEHRNYLPALFLFLPLASSIIYLYKKYSLAKYIPVLILLTLAGLTFLRADLWSDEEQLMLAWAEHNPQSIRAQRTAVLTLENRGKYKKAESIINKALRQYPENHALLADKIRFSCRFKRNPTHTIEKLKKSLGKEPLDYHYMPYMKAVLIGTTPNNCLGVTYQELSGLLIAVENNSSVTKSTSLQHQLYHTKGVISLDRKKYKEARLAFQHSLELIPSLSTGMAQVMLFIERRAFGHALTYLNYIESAVEGRNQDNDMDYKSEIPRIRQLLEADIKSKS